MSRITQNKIKPSFITSEDVFKNTDNGLEVFKNEIEDFTLSKNVRNPFQTDRSPSSRIKKSSTSGLWLLHVYNGEGGYYNAIQFIQKKYNLSFKDAISHISFKMNIQPVFKERIKVIKPSSIYYEVETQPFTEDHKNYYCINGITEEFLNEKMDIFAVKAYAINKKVYYPKKDQYMFVYRLRDEQGNLVDGKMKFLTLGKNVDKNNKWKNNIHGSSFFYLNKITENTKTVFVVKSNKDSVIFEYCGLTAIATMSENRNNIIQGLKELIDKYPHIEFIVTLGSDKQGRDTSIAITQELGLKWFNIPNRLLINDINDMWAYMLEYGFESFKKLLKNKKLL